jgi:hypothetical protein
VGRSYTETDEERKRERARKELKHEVEFYRRVEIGCYGNGPNIHPGAEGRTEKNKKKKIKRAESKTATALGIEECCTGCSEKYVTTITKVTCRWCRRDRYRHRVVTVDCSHLVGALLTVQMLLVTYVYILCFPKRGKCDGELKKCITLALHHASN